MSAEKAVLRAAGIGAGYHGIPVVTGIDLDVHAREVVSVLGPNGSGKSTLLKTIAGVLAPLAGTIWLDETDVSTAPPEEIARLGMGYVPQVDDVFESLTAEENLEMGGYTLPRSKVTQRIDALTDQLPKLKTLLKRRAGKLSGGERKLLAIARALMTEPHLLVLDEPTANLAPRAAAELLEEHVRGIAHSGAAVLLVEQRVRSALTISDRTYVLGSGKCLLAGPSSQVQADPEFISLFLGGRPATQPPRG